MAEELVFKEVLWDSSTVYLHKRRILSWTVEVDRPCHKFLSSTALTEDQHSWSIGLSTYLDHLEDLYHG